MVAGEICILAGGLSSRMGRDKSKLRLGGKTMLRRIQDTAAATGWPLRVIRRDLVERCGPLGGIYTALKTTAAERVLFLACDMPFVTVDLLEIIIDRKAPKAAAIFTASAGEKVGFPFLLPRASLPEIERMLGGQSYSLQALAVRLEAKVSAGDPALLRNFNTPNEWRQVPEFLLESIK